MLAHVFTETIKNGIQRKGVTTPSRWAEKYRVIKSQPWNFERFPWLREMHDSKAETNIGQKSAQMGYTETALNVTFFQIDIFQRDALYLLPSKTPDASDFSSSRFDPAIEESEHLTAIFNDVKNVGHKRAGAANLYIRGASSRSGLKSIPVSVIVFDEMDEMPEENVPLAVERTSGQEYKQFWKISTPTVPEWGINAAFNTSTQEHLVFSCPLCSRHTDLVFPDSLVVTGDSLLDPRLADSHLICPLCKGRLSHESKREWLRESFWQAFGDPKASDRGFYINQLYSTTVPPIGLAKAAIQAQSNKCDEQEFYNSKGGLPRIVEGARLAKDQIRANFKGHSKHDPKPQSGLLTMGMDVGSWLHCEIGQWTIDRWGADLNMHAHLKVLWEGKVRTFQEAAQLMYDWQIRMCVVDMFPERRAAFEFATRFYGHVKLAFFARGMSGKAIRVDPDGDEHRVNVDRTSWLDLALGRYSSRTIDLPKDTSNEYVLHQTALVRHYKKDGHGESIGEYRSLGDDHFAFARVYNEIALPLVASAQANENIKSFL